MKTEERSSTDQSAESSYHIIQDYTTRDDFVGLARSTSMQWLQFWQEIKFQCQLAGPLIAVSLLQMSFQITSIMFFGHLGELALSACSIAISMSNVTGFCVMTGMASCLETLCGQAFGAQQYQMLGIYLQRGLLLLNVTAIPLAFVHGYMGDILLVLGQDESISFVAGKYARWLIPYLFAQACSQPLIRFLQTQSLVYPMLLCSLFAVACHLPLCWVLVYKTSLGYEGAAISTSICNWINVLLLSSYVVFSRSCSKTRTPPSMKAFHGLRSFLRLAIPSAAMVCLEWWCYEILVLLSGLLPNPELQTSTIAACLNFANITFQIAFGLSASASTRVSNELGAGNAHAAKTAVRAAISITLFQACIVSIIILCFRNILGRLFSSDVEVIENVAEMLQLLAISSILDSTQAIFSGIARGCGWQILGALINLSSFYIVALPVSATLGFLTSLQTKGLWIGVICGPSVQIISLSIITFTTDWEKEVLKAKERSGPTSSLSTSLLLY